MTDKNIVTSVLTNTLGSYNTLAKSELQFYCPFCNHHKPKLQVNTDTQKWHCWVCNSGGKKMTSLLRKLDVDRTTIAKIREIYGDSVYVQRDDDAVVFVSLPKEFVSLSETPKGFNPEYRNAINYLKQRGIGLKEIIKYGIGYCQEGLYARRIIVPSYDADGKLNYFISRSYYTDEKMKYKNPPISKNVICLESQVNWKEEITIVEGIFDAMTLKRNVIPLLGKFPSKELINNIFIKRPPCVNIFLDNDAHINAIKIAEFFIKNGIKTKLVNLSNYKDISEAGYYIAWNCLKNAHIVDFSTILISKIGTI